MAGLQAGAPIIWSKHDCLFALTDVELTETVDALRNGIVQKSKTMSHAQETSSKRHKTSEMISNDVLWGDAFEGFETNEVYSNWGVRVDINGDLLHGIDAKTPSGLCGHFQKHQTAYGSICKGCGSSTDIFRIKEDMDESTHADDTRKRITVTKSGQRSESCILNARGYRNADMHTQMLLNAKKKEESVFKKGVKAVQPLYDWRHSIQKYLLDNQTTKTFQMTCDIFPSRGKNSIKASVAMPICDSSSCNPEDTPLMKLFEEFADKLIALEEQETYSILSIRSKQSNAQAGSVGPVKAVDVRGDLQIVNNIGKSDIQIILTELVRHGRNASHIDIPDTLRYPFNAIRRILDGKCQIASTEKSFKVQDAKNAITQLIKEDPNISEKMSDRCHKFIMNNIHVTPTLDESLVDLCRRITDIFLQTAPDHVQKKGSVLRTNGVELWEYLTTVLTKD